ncbi:MAG: hypothetical protein K2K82_03870 [Muribaculaceae bacterium]|nr:hypothetical protein [Muribaculaceae bacterium]
MSAAQEDPSTAAAKVTTKDVMSYQRNSITVIPITGMTNYDGIVTSWADKQDFDGKFDYNDINIPRIGKVTANGLDSIRNVLLRNSVPKSVASYWLQYDGKLFHQNVMEARSEYNATDADVLKDKASMVESIRYQGRELMKNSFLLVAGPTVVTESVDKKGNKSYTAQSTGFVYHVDLNDEILTSIWDNWLDEEATPEMKNKYDRMVIGLESTAMVSNVSGRGRTPEKAIHQSLDELYEKLEKKVDKWQVVTSVYEIHPIRAKIGAKEGLKNSDRYTIFRVTEDVDGNLMYKKIGFARATSVADNKHVATGNSERSKFYQISGRRNTKPGMFLKQNKDARMSVSLSGNMLDAYAMGNVDVDYLIHTNRFLGMMHYGGISIGGYFGKNTFEEKSCWIPISLHYGLGIHPLRWLEIQPNIGVGADGYISLDDVANSSEEDDESFAKKISYFAHGGVKVGFQVWYPVQIFVRADYSYKFADGDLYVPSEKNRFGFGVGAGVRVSF